MAQKDFIGKKHQQLSTWLRDTWIPKGPPVCFLEGFPGVGKSNLARHLSAVSTVPVVLVEIPDSNSVSADDLLFNLAQEWSLAGNSELAEVLAAGKDPLLTLARLFQSPVLIIMDEFQNAMTGEQAKLSGPLADIFQRLAKNTQAKGRILLLTNRLVERERWSEAYEKKSLEGLDEEDGIALLSQMLAAAEREEEVLPKDRVSVVRWLGGNPRALSLLVASLKYSPLEELVNINPDTWEYPELAVSPELIQNIERQLLERILNKLSGEFYDALCQLAVFRKPFKNKAIEVLFSDKATLAHFKGELINQFLMEQHSGWYTLHPIVREIGLKKLLDNPSGLKKAHAKAAQHYTRHFYAKDKTDQLSTLGGYFAEARYHLVQAGEPTQLGEISQHFLSHLSASFNFGKPIPHEKSVIEERIAVLASVLETPGPTGLEYHLSKLYKARGQAGDLDKAIMHIKRALGPNAGVAVWVFAGKLLNLNNQRIEAISLLRMGIKTIPVAKNFVELYLACAELMSLNNELEDAIKMLRECIETVPVENNVSLFLAYAELLSQNNERQEAIRMLRERIRKSPVEKNIVELYHFCAKLLQQDNQLDQAINILSEGLNNVPAAKNLFSLYQLCAELMAQNNQQVEALKLLREGIDKVPVEKSLVTLYLSYAELLCYYRQFDKALALLWEGLDRVPLHLGSLSLFHPLASQEAALENINGLQILANKSASVKELPICFIHQLRHDWILAANALDNSLNDMSILQAFCYLGAGQPEQANHVLESSLNLRYAQGTVNTWLIAFVQFKSGDLIAARRYLSIFLGEDWGGKDEGILPTLLRLWDETDTPWGRGDLAYYFPILPTTFTGLSYAVRRQPYAPPVLPESLKTIPNQSSQAIPTTIEPAQILQNKRVQGTFDVFLCHNSADKPSVKKIGEHLKESGLLPWLDEWELPPGKPWQELLEAQIGSIQSVAVFVGPDGIGPWQNMEMRAFLSEFVDRKIPVIPVLLPDCEDAPSLPIFLRTLTWVDFRKDDPDPFQRLVWGITQQKQT